MAETDRLTKWGECPPLRSTARWFVRIQHGRDGNVSQMLHETGTYAVTLTPFQPPQCKIFHTWSHTVAWRFWALGSNVSTVNGQARALAFDGSHPLIGFGEGTPRFHYSEV